MSLVEAPAKAIVRFILIVVAVVAVLYVLYLLRRPIGWLFIAVFLAVALSAPVNALDRRMRRGFAIAIVYLGLLLVPLLLAAVIVPPAVTGANNLAHNAPQYARDVTKFVQRNRTLRKLNNDYHLTDKLQQEASKLPGKLGGAAKTLRDVGFGLVSRIFELVTILVLTAFLLGSGRRWIEWGLETQPPDRRARVERALNHMSRAVGGYVAGALLQAAIAAVLSYVVLLILGIPFAAPLAVFIFFFDLVPLVGATIAAVLVGIVTLFVDFPTTTIVWTVWSIVYQQVENNVLQPQIQRRTIQVHPFLVLVSVLFGATLLGIVGALVAIPAAASIQIALREWMAYRRGDEAPAHPSEELPPAAPAGRPG
jgi:predicted PurR-regulated permease PerM